MVTGLHEQLNFGASMQCSSDLFHILVICICRIHKRGIEAVIRSVTLTFELGCNNRDGVDVICASEYDPWFSSMLSRCQTRKSSILGFLATAQPRLR